MVLAPGKLLELGGKWIIEPSPAGKGTDRVSDQQHQAANWSQRDNFDNHLTIGHPSSSKKL